MIKEENKYKCVTGGDEEGFRKRTPAEHGRTPKTHCRTNSFRCGPVLTLRAPYNLDVGMHDSIDNSTISSALQFACVLVHPLLTVRDRNRPDSNTKLFYSSSSFHRRFHLPLRPKSSNTKQQKEKYRKKTRKKNTKEGERDTTITKECYLCVYIY